MDGSSIIDVIDLTAENAEDEDDEKDMDMYARRRQRNKSRDSFQDHRSNTASFEHNIKRNVTYSEDSDSGGDGFSHNEESDKESKEPARQRDSFQDHRSNAASFATYSEDSDSGGDGISHNEESDKESKKPARKRVAGKTPKKHAITTKKKRKTKADSNAHEISKLGLISRKMNYEPLNVTEELDQFFYLRAFFNNNKLHVRKEKPSYEKPIRRVLHLNGVDFELFCEKFKDETRQGNFYDKDSSE